MFKMFIGNADYSKQSLYVALNIFPIKQTSFNSCVYECFEMLLHINADKPMTRLLILAAGRYLIV